MLPHSIVRRREAMALLGMKSTMFDIARKDPDFPNAMYIAARTPGWWQDELEAWAEARRERRAA